MDNISVSSSSTVDPNSEYSKKVQMIMTASDNPMVNFKKVKLPAGNTKSMNQRGLVSQIAYLPTSSNGQEDKQARTKIQPKTMSSIETLPGAFVVAKQETGNNKKLFNKNTHKNNSSLDSPETKPKQTKSFKVGKLDHQHDILQNVLYDDEPPMKKSTYATHNKLAHKFDIFGNETEIEAQPKIAKNYRGDKLEHHYDIFKQFEPLSS